MCIGKWLCLKKLMLIYNDTWHGMWELDEVYNDAIVFVERQIKSCFTGGTSQIASGACSKYSGAKLEKILLVFAHFLLTNNFISAESI